MDHRISKDMISQGMSFKGEKTTEQLNGTQIGKIATPHNMLDAYQSMYSEDAKWGYDPKTGKSLNPADKKKKVKEDVEQINEIPVLAPLVPLAAKAVAAGGAKVAAAGGAKALAGKAAGSLAKQAVADKAVSTVMGGKKKTEEGTESNPDDLIQELKDSGLFSEEELKSITEISSSKLLDAAKASEVARGKKAVAGDREGARKEVVRSKKFYDAAVGKVKAGQKVK